MKYSSFIEAEGMFADELRFVAKAVSDDETRYFMNFIFVEPSEAPDERRDKSAPLFRAVACDGRRLHLIDALSPVAASAGMEPGFYRVLKKDRKVWLARLAEAPGVFPNYRKVLPSGEAKYTSKFSGFDLSRSKISHVSRDVLKLFREFPESTPINLNYIADLGRDTSYTVEWREKNHAVVFRSDSRLAVIMPINDE